MCKNLGFKISERKRKMIRPTTKNRCVSGSPTDLNWLEPPDPNFFFFLQFQKKKKMIAKISFCLCHRLSLSSCGFATSFYKVFSLYMLFSVSAISCKLKMLENFPEKKRFCHPTDLFFSAREPKTHLFFYALSTVKPMLKQNIFQNYYNLSSINLKEQL